MPKLLSLNIHEHKNPSTHNWNWYYIADIELPIEGVSCQLQVILPPDLNPTFCRIVSPAHMAGKVCERQCGHLTSHMVKKYLKEERRAAHALWRRRIELGVLILAGAFILHVVVLNWLFFPDCNRETNDCYLIQNLWSGNE